MPADEEVGAIGEDASIVLTAASYQKCVRKLQRGEVKRVMQRGPLMGYFLSCPGCNGVATYLDKEMDYVEEPPKTVPLKFQQRRALIATNKPHRCYFCKRWIYVRDGVMHAVTRLPSDLAP